MAHRAPIKILPYDGAWPAQFEAERQRLLALFAGATVQIEHVGSTAVPGLCAKPIIDIMLGVDSIAEVEARLPQFEAHGYQYMPEHERVLPDRRFFAKPRVRPRRFHLHAVERSTRFWADHLLFRDFLRLHHEVAARYAVLKVNLASEFGDDRDGYTNAKAAFIEAILLRARREQGAA